MRITVFGCGYVGLTTAVGLTRFGHHLTAVDIDQTKIEMLRKGQSPIYEPGLSDLLQEGLDNGALSFTTDPKTGVDRSEVLFITVGTPPRKNGAADLSRLLSLGSQIAKLMSEYKVIVTKSTVPVGAGRLLQKLIRENLGSPIEFDLVSNPEFLREGNALEDFLRPDRVVIGVESEKARKVMEKVYTPFMTADLPILWTDLNTAELIKYASNAFLATKISFINEIADLCETIDADVLDVAKGMGLDRRIGPQFLSPGPGYGGSCFPKDTRALLYTASSLRKRLLIIESAVKVNETRRQKMLEKIRKSIGGFKGKTLALLGLTFKPGTDDLRESPAIPIIKKLLDSGAQVKAHDPLALPAAKSLWGEAITCCSDPMVAAAGADAIIIITNWDCYLGLDFALLKKIMRQPIIIDLRNMYQAKDLASMGFVYEGIGRGGRDLKLR